MHSPVDLTPFGTDAVHVTIGAVPAAVRLMPQAGGAGTVVRATVPLDQLMIEARVLGERRLAQVHLLCRTPAVRFLWRKPVTVRVVKRATRKGWRPIRLSVTRDRDGHMVIDYVPVTVHRVASKARHLLRRERGTP